MEISQFVAIAHPHNAAKLISILGVGTILLFCDPEQDGGILEETCSRLKVSGGQISITHRTTPFSNNSMCIHATLK